MSGAESEGCQKVKRVSKSRYICNQFCNPTPKGTGGGGKRQPTAASIFSRHGFVRSSLAAEGVIDLGVNTSDSVDPDVTTVAPADDFVSTGSAHERELPFRIELDVLALVGRERGAASSEW